MRMVLGVSQMGSKKSKDLVAFAVVAIRPFGVKCACVKCLEALHVVWWLVVVALLFL